MNAAVDAAAGEGRRAGQRRTNGSLSSPEVRAHGMGLEAVVPVWAPVTHSEAVEVLAHWGLEARAVTWRSPRPFSAAAVVATANGRAVFVKRHDPRVRTPEALAVEHALSSHLRNRGQPLPEVLAAPGGQTALALEGWTYELHARAAGDDRYRDALSWTPYATVADACAAGRALAHLHVAAAGFAAPARPSGVLVGSTAIAAAADPLAAVADLATRRPALGSWLNGRDWRAQLGPLVAPWAPAPPPEQWGHGDWHPSNLTWGGSTVTGVLDLGLANRTGTAFDLAVAIERSAVGWLDLAVGREPAVDVEATEALIDGYLEVASLDPVAVVAALPLAHLDFALAELEYFAAVVGSEADAALAWDGYACGHLCWWAGLDGRRMLELVGKAAGG